MTSKGTATYTYEAENRLVTAGGYTYTYDGDGQRVKRQNGSLGILSWRNLGGETLDESGLTGTTTWARAIMGGYGRNHRARTGRASRYARPGTR
jgi:hypothetical protein